MEEQNREEVLRFLQSYWYWLQEGAPCAAPYSRHYGLCDNLEHNFITEFDDDPLMDYLLEMFIEDGLDKIFPFGREDYRKAKIKVTMHLSHKRRNWVKSKLGIE